MHIVPPGSTYGFEEVEPSRPPDISAGTWTAWYKSVTPEVRDGVFGKHICTFDHTIANRRSILLLYRPLPMASAPPYVIKDYEQEALTSDMKISTAGEVPAETLHAEYQKAEERWKGVRGTTRHTLIEFLENRAFGTFPGAHDLYIVGRQGEWFSWYDFDLLLRLEGLMRTGGTRKESMPERVGHFYFCCWPEMRKGWSPPTEMRLPDGQVFGGPLYTERESTSGGHIIHPVHDIISNIYRAGNREAYTEKGYAPQNLRVAAITDFEFLVRGGEPNFLPAGEEELSRVLRPDQK